MGTDKNTVVMQHTAMEYQRRACLAMNYISRNLDKELSLEEIAKAASFSMFHFHRIFKAVVGETISDFTRRLRLELAANRLLTNDHAPITQIAMDCGFSSSQNFAKAFRQHFRMSPSGYRKSKAGNKDSKGENALSLQARYNADIMFTNLSNFERRTTMKADIIEMPEYNVAYVRKIGPYGKDTCEQAFNEVIHWAGPRGYLNSGAMFLVYWDNPEVTPPQKCRVDACISVPPGTNLIDRSACSSSVVDHTPCAIMRLIPTAFSRHGKMPFHGWSVTDMNVMINHVMSYTITMLRSIRKVSGFLTFVFR